VDISDLNVVTVAGPSAGHEPTIFAGQPAGLTDGLPVRSDHRVTEISTGCISGAWCVVDDDRRSSAVGSLLMFLGGGA